MRERWGWLRDRWGLGWGTERLGTGKAEKSKNGDWGRGRVEGRVWGEGMSERLRGYTRY